MERFSHILLRLALQGSFKCLIEEACNANRSRMHVWGPRLRDGRLNLVRTTWSSVVRRHPRGIFGVDSDEMDVENAVNHATNSLDQLRAQVACNYSTWRAS